MPFTFSHPAVILPFRYISNKRISITALALGSMAPDFEFFFRMKAQTDISHTIPGIFLFDIPVVVVLSFLYHCWVRNPFIEHLPVFLFQRYASLQEFKWKPHFNEHWLVILLSAFLGTLTHLLCDAFTHRYGWFVEQLPVLRSSFQFIGFELPVYFFLQYFSSLVLGLILIAELYRLPKTKRVGKPKGFLKYWTFVGLITAIITALRYRNNVDGIVLHDIIMTIIAGGLLGITISSTVYRLFRK